MTSSTGIAILLIASIAGWAAWLLSRALRTWRQFRGARIVICPETGRPAAVRIDVGHAVATAFIEDDPDVRLADCSRWAARGPCQQPCVKDARRPDATTRSVATRWYAGKACVYCGKPIASVQTLDHPVALLTPAGTTVEWPEIPPEQLPEALQTDWPVCWDCHVAESFRRQHPELVTDRG